MVHIDDKIIYFVSHLPGMITFSLWKTWKILRNLKKNNTQNWQNTSLFLGFGFLIWEISVVFKRFINQQNCFHSKWKLTDQPKQKEAVLGGGGGRSAKPTHSASPGPAAPQALSGLLGAVWKSLNFRNCRPFPFGWAQTRAIVLFEWVANSASQDISSFFPKI